MAAGERPVLLGADGRPLPRTERWFQRRPQREPVLAAIGDLSKVLAVMALVVTIIKTLHDFVGGPP